MNLKWFKFKYELMLCIFLLFLLHAQYWIDYLIFDIFQVYYSYTSYIISIVIYALISIAVIAVALHDQRKTLTDVCLLKKQGIKVWLAAILFSIGLILIFYFISDFFYQIFTDLDVSNNDEVNVSNLTLLTVIDMCLIPAIGEEILIKGVMFSRLEKQYSKKTAIIICSIIFSILHLNPVRLIPLFLKSLCTFWLYTRTKNILLPILAHFLNNILVDIIPIDLSSLPEIFLIAQILFWFGLIALIGATAENKNSSP